MNTRLIPKADLVAKTCETCRYQVEGECRLMPPSVPISVTNDSDLTSPHEPPHFEYPRVSFYLAGGNHGYRGICAQYVADT